MDESNVDASILPGYQQLPVHHASLIPHGCRSLTPEMLPLVRLTSNEIERIVASIPGGAENVQDIYPLTPLQEGMLFHHLLEKGDDSYTVSLVFEFLKRPQMETFVAALQKVIDRHDILRTAVLWERLPRPVQVVHRRVALPVELIQLGPNASGIEELKERMSRSSPPFDMKRAPLIRVTAAQDVTDGRWYALLQMHHLICDARSLEIVESEVMSHLAGDLASLTEPLQYRSHVAQLMARVHHDDEHFFKEKLSSFRHPSIPYGVVDLDSSLEMREVQQKLSTSTSERLRAQARLYRVSAATLFHCVWALVVSHTSQRDDVVYGTVLSGLLGGGPAQRGVGLFINTLPLRFRFENVSIKELIESTHRELLSLFSHEQTSLAIAQRCAGIPKGDRLFSALLNYRHAQIRPASAWTNTQAGVRMRASLAGSNYPLALMVDDLGETFSLTAQTDQRLDPDRILGYVSTSIRHVVEALETAPQTPAMSLPVLPESERAQVIESFNSNGSVHRQELINKVFTDSVGQFPDVASETLRRKMSCLSNLRIYVLDPWRRPIPIAVRGELCIGGIPAYACDNIPDDITKRIVEDPFCPNCEARMYRSGIFGRWQPDGTIEHLRAQEVRNGLESAASAETEVKIGQNQAPRGDVEVALAKIWADVLGLKSIGRHDNFFELGGHSLTSIRLHARTLEHFQIRLPAVLIFRYPTIMKMAEVIECLLPPDKILSESNRSDLEEWVV